MLLGKMQLGCPLAYLHSTSGHNKRSQRIMTPLDSTTIRILFTHRELDSMTLELARYLAGQSSWEVYVTSAREATEPWQEAGITYLPIPEIRSKFVWGVVKALRDYDKRYKFDLIYSPGSSGLSNALLATLGRKAKHIGYRGTGAKIRRLDPTYYLGVLNSRLAHLVCETEHIRMYVQNFVSQHKLSVHTKPFALEWAEEASKSPIVVEHSEPCSLRLVFVANTLGRPYKGLTTLIEAVNLLADPSISLVLVGDYSVEDERLALEGGASQCYHFIGPSREAMRYIAGADVYILPSYRDASPRVLREAMALGLPTLVSDIPGSRDLIVPSQTGLLFPAGDTKALAEAIRWMQAHPTERRAMGEAGRTHLAECYALQPYLERLETLFARLAHETKN